MSLEFKVGIIHGFLVPPTFIYVPLKVLSIAIIGAGIGGGSGGKCPCTVYELSIGISFLQYKCGLLQYVCPHTFDQLPALLIAIHIW